MLLKAWNTVIRAACSVVTLMAGSSALLAQSPQPILTPRFAMSANGATPTQAYQGWALIFEATLYHRDVYSTTVNVSPQLINAQNGSWANTIRLVVSDSNGVSQNWPIQLATIPSGGLSLDASNVGSLVWVVSPSNTAAIGAGAYRVVGILDTTASAGANGWSSTTSSNPVYIQVSARPASETVAQQELQFELMARYDHLLGNDSQALADVGTLLTQQPNSITGLAFKGFLLEQQGQAANALAAYDEAVATFFAANPQRLPEPPDALLIPQARLRSKLLSQSGTRGTPQVSIQLLDEGTQSPGVFFVDLQITNTGNDVAENVLINQITFQTLSGAGQAFLNNVLSPPLPVFTDFLGVKGTSTVRIFVTTQGSVNSFSLTENGTTADIFGSPSSFTQTQTVSLNFTGNLGPLTIAANNVTQQYGQATPPLNNVTYNGFVNGDTSSSLTGTLSCATTATQSSPVGAYPITCSGQSSASYTITYVPGTLTITPAPLSVTPNFATRRYGQSNPTFSASYGGFVNGNGPGSFSGALNCTTTATQTSSVGTYPITCSGLTSASYSINFVPGTLTITPAPLTITAKNATKILNATNPALTWTASGFVNGENASAFTAMPTCGTTAATTSPVGSYSITCSGANATNYTFSYVSGTLRVIYSISLGHVIQPPISADGTSVFNQGRTVPAKFSVYDANGVSIGTPGVVSSFFLTGIKSGTATTAVDSTVPTNNPATAFRWDPTSQQWIFNITTGSLSAGSTYIYTIALNDGSTIIFQYGLR